MDNNQPNLSKSHEGDDRSTTDISTNIDHLLFAHGKLREIIKEYHPDDLNNDGTICSQPSLEILINQDSRNEVNDIASCQSIDNFLEKITKLSKAQSQLCDVNERINQSVLNQQTTSLLHPQILGEYIKWCQEAEQHLRTIVENKDLLIYYLQQPLVTNFLTMHHKYHNDLKGLLSGMVTLLNNTEENLKLVEYNTQDTVLFKTDSCIGKLTRDLGELRNTINNVETLQNRVMSILQ